jgi:hypothetical protein
MAALAAIETLSMPRLVLPTKMPMACGLFITGMYAMHPTGNPPRESYEKERLQVVRDFALRVTSLSSEIEREMDSWSRISNESRPV